MKNIRFLIKECIIQVLKDELLSEGFDPTSCGPNPEASEGLTVYNPYEKWNAKMRTMEDMDHPIDNKDYLPPIHPEDQTTPSTLPPSGEKKYYKQVPGGSVGAVNLTSLANESQGGTSVPHDYAGENEKMRQMENEHGRYAQEAGAGQFDPRKFGLKSFKEIRNEQDPDGTKHDLKLVCKKCGNSSTCRCRKPKRMFEGLCDDCAGKKL